MEEKQKNAVCSWTEAKRKADTVLEAKKMMTETVPMTIFFILSQAQSQNQETPRPLT